MKISKNWFIRFEPNFQTEQNTILFNKVSGELFEVTEVYYDFINSRTDTDFREILIKKYNINKDDIIGIESVIKENLISLGVISYD
ncbi:phosphoglycerate mutase [Streptococcus sanguinis]|uniref:Phosphoglycerate mutase n=1 Tax=Streptococcus sanguinis TaxID=1305 RepID=A0A7H8UZQ2_STRSA|nr:phosphoglycerate mutase [Streptococcus sanguinis]QLB49876.1 phosphoglycerate mutase [Streptococcus sanguinis]